MNLNQKPRNKPKYIWSPNIWQGSQEYSLGKTVSSKNGTGITEYSHVKE